MFVFDIKAFEDSVKSTLFSLQMFMIMVGTVAFILSFFLLIISTTSNINENMWEFGVLRAIGLRKGQIARVYLYESLAVTLSAILLGLCVGFILAWIISMQFNLFLELPFTVAFPYALAFSMVVLAIGTTILGTLLPIYKINQRPIAGILKVAA
jgi:ABC-type antimicrobial peptide transport system permease subunit